MRRLLLTPLILIALLAIPASAQAASCMGKKAQKIGKSGNVHVDRFDNVILTGKRVKVKAEGDNRICSTSGNIRLTFGKGKRNMASLGSGNDKVVISHKAITNNINLGGGNDSIKIKNKAVTHKVNGGSGNDTILYAYKTVNALINAGSGNDKVTLASKATRQIIDTGSGDDTLTFKAPAKTNHRLIHTGLGDDTVTLIAKGHTTAYLSPKTNPNALSDTDTYFGGPSNDTVYDYFGGTESEPNLLEGNRGFDKINSLGSARSDIYGGDGTDWIHAASSGVSGDRIFGERGNDKLFANDGDGNAKGAFLDGGEGDDWIYGTNAGDSIIAFSGIKKIYGFGGDDTIIKTGNGAGTIEGGDGYDTISYVAHTPPGWGKYSGVKVDLEASYGSNGKGIDAINGVEHLIGSPFDDLLIGSPSVANQIDGGIGNDDISAANDDTVDGGLGQNVCEGGKQVRCNEYSPGEASPRQVIVDIGQEGILSIIGSTLADTINVGYDPIDGAYIVDVDKPVALSRDCELTQTPGRIRCPAARDLLSAVTVESGDGADSVTIDYSVPEDVSTVINTGEGYDTVTGGRTKDFTDLAEKVTSRDGNDLIRPPAGATVDAGEGSDTIHVHNPCQGGVISGGAGQDGMVFAGASSGVKASLKGGYAEWNGKPCPNRLKLRHDLEGLEGSKHNDVLISQGKGSVKTSLLGRDGNDTFYARNGTKDAVTTGGGGRKNKVYADRIDKVIWGWGLAAY